VQCVSSVELPVRPELGFDGRVVQGGLVGALGDCAGVSGAALHATYRLDRRHRRPRCVHDAAPASGESLTAIGRTRMESVSSPRTQSRHQRAQNRF
jgi:hypothetical protein